MARTRDLRSLSDCRAFQYIQPFAPFRCHFALALRIRKIPPAALYAPNFCALSTVGREAGNVAFCLAHGAPAAPFAAAYRVQIGRFANFLRRGGGRLRGRLGRLRITHLVARGHAKVGHTGLGLRRFAAPQPRGVATLFFPGVV